jgi:tetratricopeptide (TPR) repeat protein
VLQRVPEHHLARIDLAHLLHAVKEHDGALRQVEQLPKALQESARVELLRAKVLLAKGDLDGAVQVVTRLLQSAPDSGVLVKFMGDLEQTRGKNEMALKRYQRSRELSPLALEPLFAEVSLRRKMGEGLKEVVKTLEDHQDEHGDNPFILNFMATLYLEEDNFRFATNLVDRSLQREPNYWASRYLRAKIFHAAGEEFKAAVDLEEAIKLAPRQPHAYNDLAQNYRRRGDFDRAEETYKRLLELNPEEPRTANNLANLYLEQGRTEEGLQWAQQAHLGAPKDPHILDTLGWALELSGHSERAAPFLEAAAKALGDTPAVLYHWGTNLRSRGQTDQSRTVLNRLRKAAAGSDFEARAMELLASEK